MGTDQSHNDGLKTVAIEAQTHVAADQRKWRQGSLRLPARRDGTRKFRIVGDDQHRGRDFKTGFIPAGSFSMPAVHREGSSGMPGTCLPKLRTPEHPPYRLRQLQRGCGRASISGCEPAPPLQLRAGRPAWSTAVRRSIQHGTSPSMTGRSYASGRSVPRRKTARDGNPAC